MKITVSTSADAEIKEAVCQLLIRYQEQLNYLGGLLSQFEENIEEGCQIVNVPPDLFATVKDRCDTMNDLIDAVKIPLKDNRLPPEEEFKRKIFPWYDDLDSWAHDSQAFFQRIYPIVRGYTGNIIHEGDMHSLLALSSALGSMVRSLWNEITERGTQKEMVACEVYKIFDKFKRCYRDADRAFWKRPMSGFHKSVFCANGFEAVPLNLYANAFKYLPPWLPKEHSIEVSFVEGDDGVNAIVSSVGPLVEEKDIPRLWEPHVRAPSANMATDDGHGLGLPKVYNLCVSSGFRPTITSVHREGDADGWGLFTVTILIPSKCYA